MHRSGTRPWKLAIAGLITLLCLSTSEASATPLPPATVNGSIGVNIHGYLTAQEVDQLVDAGISLVRMDLNWETVEARPGIYKFAPYVQTAALLRGHNIRTLFILDYSNILYAPRVKTHGGGASKEVVAAPSNSAQFEAFKRFARAATAALSPYDPIFEIWNEPDYKFWQPEVNVDDYSKLALVACEAIHSSSPNTPVLAPAAAKPPKRDDPHPAFISAFLRTPAARCVDGISVHPYIAPRRLEETGRDWSALRTMVAKMAGGRRPPALVNSEWGLTTGNGRSENDQAWYVGRVMALNLASNVGVNVWYDWADDVDSPDDSQGFGLLHHDRTPKPAYQALKAFTSLLEGTRFKCRSDNVVTHGEALIFEGQKGSLWAIMWNPSFLLNEIKARIDPKFRGQLLDLYGRPIPAGNPAGALSFRLGPQPVYLRLPSGAAVCGDRN